jgi:phosphoribosylformimino-5-aminoimidazole carboxamide ribotide isomerase
MQIIPVIDVQHGVAVRATGGRRDGYAPLVTPLAEGSDPLAVAQGLYSLFFFPVLYVADLDGIEGRGRNVGLTAALAAALPGVDLWVDDGATARDAHRRNPTSAIPVLGSESLKGADDLATLRALPQESYVLSLDFKGEDLEGPPELLADVDCWPARVIVMTLARVGSCAGPDVQRVADIVARAGKRRVYAAGGVGDRDDVEALRAVGAAGVLLASALHAGTITAGDLAVIAGR